VVDKAPACPFANIAFKDSNEGAVANDDGRFILNLLNIRLYWLLRLVSDREIALGKAVSYNFGMKEAESLNDWLFYG
jgi:hypothetical protein